ncbi:hypothetical protein QY95_01101 [Bacillus thermotolerans]|uniref:Uncharacterized protein n=1 Tax=Bacillus thermotolerans TaxID=1221996 RepID=A0A0F5I6H6_BACTR|nr:hypothetical protein QY95_01101 [Bacillus thermotolerans]
MLQPIHIKQTRKTQAGAGKHMVKQKYLPILLRMDTHKEGKK